MRVSTPVGLTLDLRPDWYDVTDDLAGENIPFTLARKEGLGALQFSSGIYRSGLVPNPSAEDLQHMLLDFAVTRELGEPLDLHVEEFPVRLAAANFSSDFFVRVWYVSDGQSIALVTLSYDSDPDQGEVADCERMLRSIRFDSK